MIFAKASGQERRAQQRSNKEMADRAPKKSNIIAIKEGDELVARMVLDYLDKADFRGRCSYMQAGGH